MRPAVPASRPAASHAIIVAGTLAGGFLLLALLGPLIAPHDPLAVDLAHRFAPASPTHPLGTDHLGRDILSRLVAGARTTLGAVLVVLALVLSLGLAVGGLAGMLGGRIDTALMRLCDVFLTVPTFVLALFMIGALGTGLANVVAAIALSHWAWYARIVRGLVLELKTRDYVLAARIAGAPRRAIFFEHILPGVVPSLAALATLDIGHMALHVAGLSFLGLGVQPPTPEWGVMINDARAFFWTRPLLVVWPGLAIALAVLAFNRLGDALRDRLDPALTAERGL
ncbi:nickel ABC transporter permease subunit NikC [Methylobacterium indicum]|uniref:nickel ABC transporter permease subunit NikC n=1 Tax=Methylobacterium indicum TaxID=1775910 RepID=UPI003C6D6EE0